MAPRRRVLSGRAGQTAREGHCVGSGKGRFVRGRLATLTVRVTIASILTAAAFSTAAAARTVKTIAIHKGVTSVNLTVQHTTGSRPPAILLSTSPANLRCSVLRYTYHAKDTKGTFEMRIRCHKVQRGARVRLVFRRPYVRVFKLHNGTGTIDIELDKFPGTTVPLGHLTTRPRATNCTATPTGRHVGKRLFTASARVTCRGLPRNTKAVLAVGGLLAPSPSAATRSADLLAPSPSTATQSVDTKARTASTKPCSSPRTLSALGRSISWIYCYGAGFTLGPWQSQYFGQAPTQSCPSGWLSSAQVSPSALRVILNNDYPPAVYVEPWDSWAWSYALGYVTNWQFRASITAMWSWNCYQVH